MMKKLFFGLSAALLFAGCNTVAVSNPGSLSGIDVRGAGGRADRVVTLGTECYYLLWSLPLASGNMSDWDAAAKAPKNSVSFFADETSLRKLEDMLYRYAESHGCDVCDIIYECDDDADVNFIQSRSASVSGVLVPRK